MMRVDAGKYKGRRLLENKYDHIRPTTDKVRQALFVKLQFFVPDARVLDLFCGTGAMGIEAISRGAEKMVFVDKDARSVQMTKNNLKLLGIENKVFKCDALVFLERCTEQFDLIILDPPYKSGLYEKVLSKISEKNLLADDGIIVCEHAKEDDFDYQGFVVQDEKRYGTIMLTYLTK
ncbi:MAG: 16S rRNA (guanine(966)-N(2))-methyltransferase RsmD [Clostridia bacterium]|nr:16S rRNA (guanine(966)-N(2))-methyltransferase RsmD [Clostridia bacterium]